MSEAPRKVPVVFYRTAGGNEVVLEWLRALDIEDQYAIGQDLQRVQFRWPIGMPLCRSLGKGLWEVRTNLTSKRIARLYFFFDATRLVVVHGIIKKTQRTPKSELDLAYGRKREFE